MKKMKRIITLVLVVVLALALCVPAMASNPNQGTENNIGKITINNATEGETYGIYLVADLESFVKDKAYSYKLKEEWKPFFTSVTSKKYFDVSEDGGYIATNNQANLTEAGVKVMAKDMLAYAKTNGIAAKETITCDSSKTVIFENLPLGYYLVDSTLGALCALDTTDTEFDFSGKNTPPTIEKKVQDDRNSNEGLLGTYGDVNDADLYQPIQFKMIIDAKAGALNYVVHDTMTNMVLDTNSVEMYFGDPKADKSNLISADNYTVLTAPIDANAPEHGCSFDIVFEQTFLDTLTTASFIHIYYKASLTDAAVIGSAGNPNQVYLAYGQNSKTAVDETITYTYEFDMVKTDNSGNYLDGATFKLYDAAVDGNEIPLVKVAENKYRVAKEGETPVSVIEIVGGKCTNIYGLDGHTSYWLEEIDAPDGYNLLTSRKEVAIDNQSLVMSQDGSATAYATSAGGIQIKNSTGVELPETGGMGTTLFITIGCILVIGAGVLLVVRTRMSKMSR